MLIRAIADRVIELFFFCVAQYFVGMVDFCKAFRGVGRLIFIRVKFLSHYIVAFFYFESTSVIGDAQNAVKIAVRLDR